MLKRGILFLLVFIIFLEIGFAQENTCTVASPDSVAPVAQRILDIYSQIDLPFGVTPQQAAIDSINRWQPSGNIDPNWVNFKSSLISSIQGGAGSCIDDYSLNSKNDCWNQDALCINNKCILFYDLGLPRDIMKNLEIIFVNQSDLERMTAVNRIPTDIVPLIPIFIKVAEDEESGNLKEFLFFKLINIYFSTEDQRIITFFANQLNNKNLDYDKKTTIATILEPLIYSGDQTIIKIIDDVIAYSGKSALSYSKQMELMRKNPTFDKIYLYLQGRPELVNSLSGSIAIATFRYMKENSIEPTDRNIYTTITNILRKKDEFEKKVILGDNTHLIVFTNEDQDLFSNTGIINFAKNRGVNDVYEKRRIIRQPQSIYLRGLDDRQNVIDAILKSKDKSKVTIWASTHGLPNFICLGEGVLPPTYEDNLLCEGFRYNEFADILLERGDLDEIVLIVDACFSYDFSSSLLKDLRDKGSSSFPTIITITNKGNVGYANTGGFFGIPKSLFLLSLESLDIGDKNPLLGEHIYKAEFFSRFSDDELVQDSAVFFSESGFPIEIAKNFINSGCDICIGTSCPIEPVQGISS